jgi:UDP-3-O-[3-hydroxymyristoyl] N-acetylglucosamine deacetylase
MPICNLSHLRFQQTIAAPLTFVGIGLHSGERAVMRLRPVAAGHGITLIRRDLAAHEQSFDVNWKTVRDSSLCTVIGNPFGHEVSTIEHLLSALAGLGIDNIAIELDGPEVPIMDGSAMPFVEALEKVGVASLDTARNVIVIRRPVRLQQGANWAELLPYAGCRITVSIDFEAQVIGTQSMSIDVTPSLFRQEIAPARTFGFAEQLDHLYRRGLALGGSIKNAILVRDGRVANLEGLRFRDEFVRHKLLDVIGDLSLTGAPIIGHYRGNRPGHQLNTDLVSLLMEDNDAWERHSAIDLERIAGNVPGSEGRKRAAHRSTSHASKGKTRRRLLQHSLGGRIRQLFDHGRN